MNKYHGLKKYTTEVEYIKDFQPFYVMQQKFTRKASIKAVINERYNIYYLIVNDIKICKVTIDKQAYTKSRFYLFRAVKLDACNVKYINDFLQQHLTLRNSTIIKKLVNKGTITKDAMLKYAGQL